MSAYKLSDQLDWTKVFATIFVPALSFILLTGAVFGVGWGWAHFRLWKAEYAGKALEIEREYAGKAILAEAEYAKKAMVQGAIAELEAAGKTAEAIAIVGAAAQMYPEYRQQEFYKSLGAALEAGNIDQIIYLPTEAGLPITEAGKRNKE